MTGMDFTISMRDNIVSNEYEKDSVQVQYGNASSFTLRVGGGVAFPDSFTYTAFVSDKVKKDYERFQNHLIGESNVDVSTKAGAILGWIAGSAKGYGPFTSPVPVKKRGQDGSSRGRSVSLFHSFQSTLNASRRITIKALF